VKEINKLTFKKLNEIELENKKALVVKVD
jgi:hypothetical protein